MNSVADVWTNVLQQLKKDLSETTITTWFDELTAVDIRDNTFYLHCPNDFKKRYIESLFVKNIKAVLLDIFSVEFDVRILDSDELAEFQGGGAQTHQNERFTSAEFTFDTFVVGPSNKLAYAASMAVAEHPAQNYNPLLIYGDSGLGKTHLLYAIAHKIHQNHPDYRIVYIKGDSFTNELIQAIREGRNPEFREKYRSADVFLMDDVQFIAGRESTQEEMFHTFNTLYEAGRQIVFTADRPPKEMLRLDDRLRTRFEWGLPVDIQPPDYETRVAIIKNKAIRRGMNLPDPVLQYIAENITANVRQIEGTVNKIMALRDLEGSDIDAATVTRAVRDMFKDPTDILPTSDVIIDEVCKYYSIENDVLRGQGRTKDTALARQIAMFLIREMTNMSLKEIGREFDNRDHTTVLHSTDRIEKLKKSNPDIAEVIKDIRANINARYE